MYFTSSRCVKRPLTYAPTSRRTGSVGRGGASGSCTKIVVIANETTRTVATITNTSSGEQAAVAEEGLAPSDGRPGTIGPCTHNWLHDRAGQRTLLREQSDGPGRDLRVPLEVKAGGEVEERVDDVRAEDPAGVERAVSE